MIDAQKAHIRMMLCLLTYHIFYTKTGKNAIKDNENVDNYADKRGKMVSEKQIIH